VVEKLSGATARARVSAILPPEPSAGAGRLNHEARRILCVLPPPRLLSPAAPWAELQASRDCRSRANFRAPEPLPPAQAASLADLKWFEVFKDDKLQELIRTALQQNYDLRDAVARVEKRGPGSASRGPNSFRTSAPAAASRSIGSRAMAPRRYRRSFCPRRIAISEPPRCTCCRSKSTSGETAARHRSRARQSSERRGKPQSRGHDAGERRGHRLPFDARTRLRTRDFEATLADARGIARTHQIAPDRRRGSTLLDLRQAEQLVDTAAETIPDIQQQIEQTENQISSAGRKSRRSVRAEKPHRAGFASRSAGRLAFGACSNGGPISARRSRRLIAANAQIGVARAAYFPS
jgi:outer membrane protein, multidrug efflux system